jgi:hypothetical protein
MADTRSQDPSHLVDQTHAGRAREDHGRAVTANRPAAAWYRQAQRAMDRHRAVVALRLAVAADPAFEVALADLAAITGTRVLGPGRGQMNWERHHIEVVRLAATGNVIRAADLLREHLACVGCDPLAFRIAAQFRETVPAEGFGDIADRLPRCHALNLELLDLGAIPPTIADPGRPEDRTGDGG